MWADDKIVAMDFETSGTLPEYALQPWRLPKGDAWITSVSAIRKQDGKLVPHLSKLFPTVADLRSLLEEAIANKWILLGWNVTFDISWLFALGLGDLVMQLKWLDGMLLYRHLEIEPEYDITRPNKRSYGLKAAVAQYIPAMAGYEEEVDFHSTDPAELAKLQKYNDRDSVFTWVLSSTFWSALSAEQRRAAVIEAECLPMVAQANCEGMLVDTLAARELAADLDKVAADMLAKLAPHGVTEKVVRSPIQLSKLMFDDWGLPVLKENTSKKTGKVSRSTDKEVLHELAFMDDRCADLRAYREALNNRAKFADAPLLAAEYNSDGRARPSAIVFGTYCVPGDVEVLTPQGWEQLVDWRGGDIMQVKPDLTMAFLPADKVVGPTTAEWVRVKHRRIDCDFTPGHTVPYLKQKTFTWATTKAISLAAGYGEAKYIPVAGNAVLAGRYSADQMRFFAAVQADGYFRYSDGYFKGVTFTLKKDRKKERLRQLLHDLDIPYREYVCDTYPDRTEFHIVKSNLPGWLSEDRKVFGPWVLDTTAEGLRAFVDEVVHWDGSPHSDGGLRYVSSIESNVTWVVTAAALVGRKASQHARNADGLHSCHISIKSTPAHTAVNPRRDVSLIAEEKGSFCASTQTGFWLARSKGKIFVTGNSGRLTYASKQGKNKDERQTGFALHQEKRGSQYRSIIIPPPGYTLMEFDASGQELRWMAIASGDPTMLDLCQPGEDPHSYMGARIVGAEYQDLMRLVREEDATAKDNRQLGKVANLCIAEGTQVLTDRGPCNIEHVRSDDRVWDGERFVTHDGVSFSGVRQVITYQGVSGTPDHKVLVDGSWVELQEASRHGWVIEPALGAGRTSACRAAFRIVGGLIGRAVHTLWRAVCNGALRLRDGEGSEPPVHGDRPLHAMQKLRDDRQTPSQRQVGRRYFGQKAAAEAGQRYAPTVHQPKGSLVSQLWRSWDRVPVRLYKRGCGVYSLGAAFGFLHRSGHRPDQQRRSLRAWKLALGYTSGELSEPRAVRTYDITNCGPHTRFAANGVVVHNSLQYRTSAPKLRSVARVQYNIPMELPEAQRIHKTYQNTYTLVPVYWRQQIAQTRQLGYVETFGGRRVQVVGNWDGDRGWSMGSTAINYRIQGTGAEQKYLAMAVIKSYLVSIGARFAWDLHDGIYLWVPDAKVAEAAVRIKALLDNLPYRQAWGFTPPIPLPWDCKVGKSWGALKEYKFD